MTETFTFGVAASNRRTGRVVVLHRGLTSKEADTIVSKHYPLSESQIANGMRYYSFREGKGDTTAPGMTNDELESALLESEDE